MALFGPATGTGSGLPAVPPLPNAPHRPAWSQIPLPHAPAAPPVPAHADSVSPLTSTINCTPPPEPLKTRIFPSAPNGRTIVLAMVRPAWKFTFEVPGRAVPP